jgi:hypothetical protein
MEDETPAPIVTVVSKQSNLVLWIIAIAFFLVAGFLAWERFFPVETEKVKELNQRIKFQCDSLEKAYISRDSAVTALQPFKDSITAQQENISLLERKLLEKVLFLPEIAKKREATNKKIELATPTERTEMLKKRLPQDLK